MLIFDTVVMGSAHLGVLYTQDSYADSNKEVHLKIIRLVGKDGMGMTAQMKIVDEPNILANRIRFGGQGNDSRGNTVVDINIGEQRYRKLIYREDLWFPQQMSCRLEGVSKYVVEERRPVIEEGPYVYEGL